MHLPALAALEDAGPGVDLSPPGPFRGEDAMSNRQKIKRTTETYSKMALSFKAQGDVASALRMAEKAAPLNPRSPEIRLQYADLLLVTVGL